MFRWKNKLTLLLAFVLAIIPAAAAAEAETTPAEISGLSISMTISKHEALVNGQPVVLENAPFLLDNVPYVPLRETVERFGGVIAPTYLDGSVSGALFALPETNDPENWVFSQIWLENTDYMFNGSLLPRWQDDYYRKDYGAAQA